MPHSPGCVAAYVAFMDRFRKLLFAISLVASPLFILAYWLTYPAYGELAGEGVIRTVSRDPSMTAVSDALALLGALLAVPMSLALMRVLRKQTPNLAMFGGSVNLLGWVAVSILLMTDVVATEIAQVGSTDQTVQLFKNLLTNPLVLALNVAASLHILGAVLIGAALWRSKLVSRPLAFGALVAGPIHLGANLAGLLWLDSITWVVVAVAYGLLIPLVLSDEPEPTPVSSRYPRSGVPAVSGA
jgi:hypothetical protein